MISKCLMILAAGPMVAMVLDLSPSTTGVLSLMITSSVAVLMAWIAYKQKLADNKQKELTQTIIALEKNTNSIKDALVDATAKKAEAEGNLQGRVELKAEQLDAKTSKTL